MNANQKKLVVAGVLLIAAVGVYLKFGRSAEPLTGKLSFVCVATGEIFHVSRDDVPSILPGKNKKTEQYTLLPVVQRGGTWFVSERYVALLRDPEELGKVNKYVDPQTLEVLKSPRP